MAEGTNLGGIYVDVTLDTSKFQSQLAGVKSNLATTVGSMSRTFSGFSKSVSKIAAPVLTAAKAYISAFTALSTKALQALYKSNTVEGKAWKKQFDTFRSQLNAELARIGSMLLKTPIFGKTIPQWMTKLLEFLRSLDIKKIEQMVKWFERAVKAVIILKVTLAALKVASGALKFVELLANLSGTGVKGAVMGLLAKLGWGAAGVGEGAGAARAGAAAFKGGGAAKRMVSVDMGPFKIETGSQQLIRQMLRRQEQLGITPRSGMRSLPGSGTPKLLEGAKALSFMPKLAAFGTFVSELASKLVKILVIFDVFAGMLNGIFGSDFKSGFDLILEMLKQVGSALMSVVSFLWSCVKGIMNAFDFITKALVAGGKSFIDMFKVWNIGKGYTKTLEDNMKPVYDAMENMIRGAGQRLGAWDELAQGGDTYEGAGGKKQSYGYMSTQQLWMKYKNQLAPEGISGQYMGIMEGVKHAQESQKIKDDRQTWEEMLAANIAIKNNTQAIAAAASRGLGV